MREKRVGKRGLSNDGERQSVIFRTIQEVTKQVSMTQNVIVVAAAIGYTQPPFTCSKLTIETREQGVKYVQG